LLFCSGALLADDKTYPGASQLGVGAAVGWPSSVTLNYWLAETSSIDLGVSAFTSWWLLVYGDYLWHFPDGFGHDTEFKKNLTPYVGIGLGAFQWYIDLENRPSNWRNYADTEYGIYARIPFGMEWYAPQAHIGVFGEFVPGIVFGSNFTPNIDFSLGGRFYF
jgi:hypothetical protein